jgi:MFS transporter, NNP family, nitrate/nitrite transporter
VLLLLAFLAGLGGGNFSSFMPSTSLFFPRRLQGTALAVQAGIGNFGVSLVQFLTPVLIGTALFGPAVGTSQTLATDAGEREVWLQNAAIIWLPLVLLAAVSRGTGCAACRCGRTSGSSPTSSGRGTPGS